MKEVVELYMRTKPSCVEPLKNRASFVPRPAYKESGGIVPEVPREWALDILLGRCNR